MSKPSNQAEARFKLTEARDGYLRFETPRTISPGHHVPPRIGLLAARADSGADERTDADDRLSDAARRLFSARHGDHPRTRRSGDTSALKALAGSCSRFFASERRSGDSSARPDPSAPAVIGEDNCRRRDARDRSLAKRAGRRFDLLRRVLHVQVENDARVTFLRPRGSSRHPSRFRTGRIRLFCAAPESHRGRAHEGRKLGRCT